MNILPDNFKERFLSGMLELLWRQWSALGVAGGIGRAERRVIDADALLLATCVFGRWEPRLFDEMLDWLGVNGWCINVQRLRSLMRQYGFGCERVAGCVGALYAKGSDTAKWRRLAMAGRPVGAVGELEPLFYLPDGRPQPRYGEPDERFAAHGWHRGRWEPRGMSQAANPEWPANLMYRLRALFGVNARADLMVYLLTHERGHPPEMARQMGYFPKTLQMTLGEMACSGVVGVVRKGREKHYALDRGAWKMLEGRGGTILWAEWAAWPQFYAAMGRVWAMLQRPELGAKSMALQAVEWQKQMRGVLPLLQESGVGGGVQDHQRLAGECYLAAMQTSLLRCVEEAKA